MEILKGGTLRFWGEWFGRPFDNYHRVINADFTENILVISFDNGEICTIYNPQNIVNEKNEFSISNASKIVWEWYSYGRKHTSQNLCKLVYTFLDNKKVLVENIGVLENGSKIINSHGYFAFEIC